MTDPRSNVRPGQSLSVAAAQINWINDQMRKGGVTQPPAESLGSPYTWVYAKNESGYGASRWDVLNVNEVAIIPTADDADTATRQFCAMPVISLGAKSSIGAHAVCLEPIPALKIGKVAIAGVVQVKPDDVRWLGDAVELWRNDDWALVRFGDGFGIRLGKTVEKIEKDSFGKVDLYSNAVSKPARTDSCELLNFPTVYGQLCAQNLLETVPAHCMVYLVRPEGGDIWHIIGRAADGPDDCGSRTDHGVKLTFSASCGTGAEAHGVVTGDCPGPISSVVVDSGGSGYARKGRVAPELEITGGGGTGATFTPTFTKNTSAFGTDTWTIASVSVSGGTGYTDGAKLHVTPQPYTNSSEGLATELRVHVSGPDKVPTSVSVVHSGEFYKESDSATPYIPTVTVNAASAKGSGATFTAHIDDSPASSTFGQITSVSVGSPGSGYLGTVNSGATKWNGLDFSTITGYDATAVQMLGHDAGGCLKWFTTTECSPPSTGVCCVDNSVDSSHTTKPTCEAAGGTWKAGASPGDFPGPCCPDPP